MNNWQKAEIACCKFELRAAEKGVVVSKPVTDNCSYDRVVEWGGKFYRVQIKYATTRTGHSKGAVVVDMRRKTYKYSSENIDAVVVYIPFVDKLCWFDSDIFDDKVTIIIRYEKSKNNQRKKTILVEDYEW